MRNTRNSKNLYLRGKVIWIDFQKNGKRLRKSTKLKNSQLAINFVKKNYEKYLENGAEIWLKKEFIELENQATINKITKKEKLYKSNKQRYKKGTDTFYEIFSKLNAEKSFLKKGTIKTYTDTSKLLLDYLHSEKIDFVTEFTRSDCVNLMNFLFKNNKAKSTINRYFSYLQMALKYAFENNVIKVNPYFKPKIKALKTKEILPFTLDEVKLILKNATGNLKVYLYIAFFTGMRSGEIMGLVWGDIDFEKKEISVNKTLNRYGELDVPKTKNSNRIVDMLDILSKELQKHKKDNKQNIILMKYHNVRLAFKALLKSLNLENRRLYDTRHTFASIMLSRGEEPMWVGCKMLGHKDLNETFKSYAKYLPKEVKTRAKFLDNENF